ncbi:MAG TPA: class I SAM-dependent methyltransferase [Candidatus Binataceae bacterium]|nr:class I SAM-dependent methyltransferase [Candidatus Binataceae bacterium]
MAVEKGDAAQFLDSPELYDAIYHFKNYAREAERLREIIIKAAPGARTILDVACGTGEHSRFLKDYFSVDGVDIRESYLIAARQKNPAGRYLRADMTAFDLQVRYDVVTCLFSAIGYVGTLERLERAITCMGRHLNPGGILLVEPWFPPGRWKPGLVSINSGEIPGGAVCRMSLSRREGQLSVMSLHYLAGTVEGVRHYSERLALGLFTREEMERAFERAGLRVSYENDGLMGRGMYYGRLSP